MAYFYNRSSARPHCRALRHKPSKPEEIVWERLRNRRLLGLKFYRQYSVGVYIVDFYCAKHRLAIEVDGASHFENQEAVDYDHEREIYLKNCGIKVLRFTNQEVLKDIDGVLKTLTLTLSLFRERE